MTVLAADNVEQSQEMTDNDILRLTGVDTYGDVDDAGTLKTIRRPGQ